MTTSELLGQHIRSEVDMPFNPFRGQWVGLVLIAALVGAVGLWVLGY